MLNVVRRILTGRTTYPFCAVQAFLTVHLADGDRRYRVVCTRTRHRFGCHHGTTPNGPIQWRSQ